MTSDDRDRWIGRRIGAYEIVALIGSGGMGEVYRARRIDAQYEKEVAIKLVPSAAAAKFILQRLRAERQILAKLDHPHIARLIDGGVTEEGLPYLIMDLVDGQPIDQYCEQRKLRVRDRLRLFRDVCSAVSYAHQHLVVHRDLKPSNILVTADGTVKLLDFGIAKLLQPTAQENVAAPTITGTSTATPEFASPEQLLGKPITTTSDVYSLGVMLYLLLTRKLPYRSTPSLHELIHEVCETEPPRPSTVVTTMNARHGDRVDADLDAITLRALRKEPDKRYRSVEEFSEDIRCYLEAMPVQAREGQLAYRTGKFLRRRKLEVTAATLIVVMLVGGIVSSIRQARLADTQRVRAEHHFASVRELAEVSMFQLHDAIKDLPGATGARELVVNTALEYLNALAGEAGHDRSLQHDLASAYVKVADIQGKAWHANTGKPEESLNSYSKAIALLEPLVAAEPSNTPARDTLAQSYLQQSRLLILLGEPKKATALSKKSTDIFESLAAANPNITTRAAYADACRVHGQNTVATGGSKAALPYSYKAIEIMEDLHRQRPDDLELQYALGMAYDTAGSVVQHDDERQQAFEKATALHLKALAIDEELVAKTGGRNATYVRSLLADRVNLCSQYHDNGQYLRAVENCRAAQPLVARLRSDENNAQIALDSASLEWNLGAAQLGAGLLSDATRTFEQNVGALEDIIKHTDTIQVKYLLAACEQGLASIHAQLAASRGLSRAEQLRRWRLARELYQRSVPRFEDIMSHMELQYPDRVPRDKAIAGLARSKEEVARLEAPERGAAPAR